MYLSPCLIAVIVIIVYVVMGKQNQSKLRNYVNKNQKIFVILAIAAGLYYFMNVEGINGEGTDEETNEETNEPVESGSAESGSAESGSAESEPGPTESGSGPTESEPSEPEPNDPKEKECLIYWPPF